jgi:AraC-like DNA-binding protein
VAVLLDTTLATGAAAWDLGGLQVLGSRGAALPGSRGEREIRATRTALVAVTFSAAGVITGTRNGEAFAQQPGEMLLLDLTEPFVMSWPNDFSAFTIAIPHAELRLASDVIRRGVRNLRANPMYELVRRHVARVCAALPTIDGSSAAGVLGDVTRDLVRALLASSAAPPRPAAGSLEEALAESLPLRIELYIREHLGDPALSARQIAEAHFISVRQLYYLWSGRDCTLAEWIMSERLAAAGRELASPHRPAISAVARRWGFADPTHFSHRFKAKYDVTPRSWRQLHLAAKAGTPA